MRQTLILPSSFSHSPPSSLNVKEDRAWMVDNTEKKLAMNANNLKNVQNVLLTFSKKDTGWNDHLDLRIREKTDWFLQYNLKFILAKLICN